MAKIRHVAICTNDPEKTAAWYMEAFGLAEVGRTASGGYYLSDGDINFAVLPARSPEDVGVSHFGFMVEDPEAIYRKLEEMGAIRQPTVPLGNQYFEVKFLGPDAVTIDVSEHGWVGAKPLEAPAAETTAK